MWVKLFHWVRKSCYIGWFNTHGDMYRIEKNRANGNLHHAVLWIIMFAASFIPCPLTEIQQLFVIVFVSNESSTISNYSYISIIIWFIACSVSSCKQLPRRCPIQAVSLFIVARDWTDDVWHQFTLRGWWVWHRLLHRCVSLHCVSYSHGSIWPGIIRYEQVRHKWLQSVLEVV